MPLPTSTSVTVSVKTKLPNDTQAIVVFAAQGKRISGDAALVLPDNAMRAAMRLLSADVVRGKVREIDFDLLDSADGENVQRVYVVGLGEAEKLTPERVRIAGATALRTLRKHQLTKVAIVPAVVSRGREAVGSEMTVSGMLLAAFSYAEHKGKITEEKKAKKNGNGKAGRGDDRIEITILSTPSAAAAIESSARRGQIIADAQNYARTIAFRPGNDVNPPVLGRLAQELAREAGLSVKVYDEKQMAKMGMGGILGVGQGSVTPPRLIALEYSPKGGAAKSKGGAKGKGLASASQAPLLLVGKAITFDTGGISIKPALNMQAMVFDKCGGMAVLGAMLAISRLKLPIPVVGVLASAENHVSGDAYRPGDILKMYNGVTVEITNTDAEGRLVLGDALAWGIEQYKPRAVVNLATLTGACTVALGHTFAGAFSNDDGVYDQIKAASETAGENIWRLPLHEDYTDALKSVPADILNAPGRPGGACTAAAFLECFVPSGDDKVPWVHLDIAPVANTDKDLPYYGQGATGWGIRTLVEWVAQQSAKA